ncbi:hypothetical protein B0J13DRAFT_618961 [Dactylonectria estremocensis]|uniref:Uncharacterized protein n=1 Tax=Dactylonectria estremocensis TaxID=1079267 RepID=A0A9P9F4T8_9HYPO|nr:hypothetical protein B0J13DRAFT_618961 [Dactylonectria estremocensis]
MASPMPQSQPGDVGQNHESEDESKPIIVEEAIMPDSQKQSHTGAKTPEPGVEQQPASSDTPSTPGTLPAFDWEDFETRYEKALHDADEHEEAILKDAGALSKYFKVWASAASAHDDERAAKRLQTRRRFVNLSEENMAQKQQHYDEVVRAFESALALLRSKRDFIKTALCRPAIDMPRAENVGTATKHDIPTISEDDLFGFHETHFGQDAVALFGSTFMDQSGEHQPHDDVTYDVWEDEDDLGYYEDGVKRTLTDEQIEIFRHSELEALRKEQEKQSRSKVASSSDEAMELNDTNPPNAQVSVNPSALATTPRNNKKKRKKGVKRGRPEPKPDLRKRTWDVVDKGLDSLDYD